MGKYCSSLSLSLCLSLSPPLPKQAPLSLSLSLTQQGTAFCSLSGVSSSSQTAFEGLGKLPNLHCYKTSDWHLPWNVSLDSLGAPLTANQQAYSSRLTSLVRFPSTQHLPIRRVFHSIALHRLAFHCTGQSIKDKLFWLPPSKFARFLLSALCLCVSAFWAFQETSAKLCRRGFCQQILSRAYCHFASTALLSINIIILPSSTPSSTG